MVRIHRSLRKRAKRVNPDDIANQAEDYIENFRFYAKDLEGVRGLAGLSRIRTAVKKIDAYEREIIRAEEKLKRLMEKRAIEAARLEEMIFGNLEVMEEYFSPEEMREIWG